MTERTRTMVLAATLALGVQTVAVAQAQYRTEADRIEAVARRLADEMGLGIERTDRRVRASGGHGPEQRSADFVVTPASRSREFARRLVDELGPGHMTQLEDAVYARPEPTQIDYRFRAGEGREYTIVEHELTARSDSGGNPDHVHAQMDPDAWRAARERERIERERAERAQRERAEREQRERAEREQRERAERERAEREERRFWNETWGVDPPARADAGDGSTDGLPDVSRIACPYPDPYSPDAPVDAATAALAARFIARGAALGVVPSVVGPRALR